MGSRHSIPHSNSRPVTNKDYSNTAFSNGANQQSNRLHGRSKELVQLVLSNLASSGDTLSVEQLATQFRMTAGTLRISLRAPIDLGLLSINRGLVYPTVKLLQQHDPNLNADAAAILVACQRTS